MRLRECAPHVLVATSDMYMTNTTIVFADRKCLLIDPALLPSELQAIAEDLAELGLQVAAGFATHPHWDHVLWSSALGEAPRFATGGCLEALQRHREELVEEQLRGAGAKWYAQWEVDLAGKLSELPADRRIPWSGPQPELLIHNGHAPGHCALFFRELGALVAGDMLSDVELPGLNWDEPNQLEEYHDGLRKLSALDGVELVIPGHGHVGDSAAFEARAAADADYLEGLAAHKPIEDARLTGWPPMEHQHNHNVEGFAKAQRGE